jgi:hypothetical protein
MIILDLNDFSYNCSILIKYTRTYGISSRELDINNFHRYINEYYDLNKLENYDISKMDTIKSTLNKQSMIYSTGSYNFIRQLSEFLEIDIKNVKSIEVLGIPLFSKPEEWFSNNNRFEIPLTVIHKNLVLCKTINYYRKNDELNAILEVMNLKYGIPLITQEDKNKFVEYFKAS